MYDILTNFITGRDLQHIVHTLKSNILFRYNSLGTPCLAVPALPCNANLQHLKDAMSDGAFNKKNLVVSSYKL